MGTYLKEYGAGGITKFSLDKGSYLEEGTGKAIIAAVNHDGDSDSTGSITGNIMGAIYGYDHLRRCNLFAPEGYTFEQVLELSDVILAMADELALFY